MYRQTLIRKKRLKTEVGSVLGRSDWAGFCVFRVLQEPGDQVEIGYT
jgi:hypothetical protein